MNILIYYVVNDMGKRTSGSPPAYLTVIILGPTSIW